MSQLSIWALGGHSSAAPRDTFPAYWGALGAGADGLVVSVRRSREGHLLCAPYLSETTGSKSDVSDLNADEIAKLDAGTVFRSRLLDEDQRFVDTGSETPWVGHEGGRPDALSHPELERVLLHFSRRTRLCPLVEPGDEVEATVEALGSTLRRSSVLHRVLLAGDRRLLAAASGLGCRLCLLDDEALDFAAVLEAARDLGADRVMAAAGRVLGSDPAEPGKLVTPDEGFGAPTPEQFEALVGRDDIAGVVTGAVDRARGLSTPRGLLLSDSFAGPSLDPDLWSQGHSRKNEDTRMEIDDGFHVWVEGNHYSGGALISAFQAVGDFDARISYEVENPTQGTTFELAVIHVDAGYHRPNLTFDVHGAPPYASSERDEDDGFRIGWNNGPALTRWFDGDDGKSELTSSNLYNNYSRDVGYAGADRPSGDLRLVRSGDVFNAYYRDAANPGWVLSGSVAVPALAPAVFFRLGAKHWRKKGNPAPTNHVRLFDFVYYQW